MRAQNKIKERIQVGLRISESDYYVGLVYLLRCLFSDYFSYASEEDRLRGIMLRYQDEINGAFFDYFSTNLTEERQDSCGRVLFLYKKLIYTEFKRLNKRLSPADRVMVIIKRILEFLDAEDSLQDSNLVEINEISTKLYDNIRWRQKFSSLKHLMTTISDYLDEGFIGNRPILKYSLREEDIKFSSKSEMHEPEEVLLDDGDSENSLSTVIDL